MKKKWWMKSVGYEIYPKSFYDSNQDGIGDLKGIYQKLDYLNELGVDLIWICPFYDSPMDDNGYDVRDFLKVDEQFGSIDDLKALINRAHELKMKVIFDFVLNHTSDEHHWFIESKKSEDNPYRTYYIWQKGKAGREPTNWASFFGGSCWQYDKTTDAYYMKIFSNKMPDLNWENPDVRYEMQNIAKTWLEFGVDGFRIDAVSHLDRAPFVDSRLYDAKYILDWDQFSNLPKVHTYLKEFHQNVFSKYDVLTIGEVGGSASIKQAKKYASFGSNELDMVFNFDHNWCNNLFDIDDINDLKTDVIGLKKVFAKWQTAFAKDGWLPLNWLNHDQPRLMSQYGSKKYPHESAKMLASALYLMRGTPFIYQGEEIGMTNFPFQSIDDFKDIASINYYMEELQKDSKKDTIAIVRKVAKNSRDNPRTPMQWSNNRYAGFSQTEPWIKVNPNYHNINVKDSMKDKHSVWHHYKKLIHLRKTGKYHELITYGTYKMLIPEDPDLYVYLRKYEQQTLIVINSFSENEQTYLIPGQLLETVITNYSETQIKKSTITLRPYESVALLIEETS